VPVVDGQAELHALTGTGQLDALVDLPQGAGRHGIAAADHAQANPLLEDRRPLLDHVLFQQLHEELQLRRRPLPVLAGEAVKRKLLDLQPGTFLDRATDRRHALPVAFDPRQARC